MSGYSSVFTGSQVVLPSNRSYSALALSATTTLAWPSEGATGDNDLLTAILDVTPASAGIQLRLPPATEASPGSAAIFVNSGADSFDLRVNDGTSSLATVAAGTALYAWLKTNTTDNGTWGTTVLGAGSVAPSLASQTGAGLVYFNGLINAGYPSEDVATATYALTEGDRATAIVNTGGALTVNLADLTTAFEANFFFIARNSGGGAMVLEPDGAQTIDGQANVSLDQGQSCFVILDSTGGTWRTIGRQTAASASVTAGVIDVSGTGDYVLSTSETGFAIQQFDGILTGNRTVSYGALTGVWYVYNNTSGAFTLTFRVDGSDTGVEVAQGDRAIITLNGVNATLAFTTAGGGGTVTAVTASSPLASSGGTAPVISLNNSGVSGGTYGGSAGWPIVVVTTKGLVSSATTLPSSSFVLPYLPTTGGTGTGAYALVGQVTVNSLVGTSGTFSGAVSAASFTGTTAAISGTGAFGVVNGTTGVFTGGMTASSFGGTSAVLSGGMTAASYTGTSANLSGTGAFGVVTATSVNASGAISAASYTGTNANLSGSVGAASFTGTTANLSGTGAFGVLNATSAVFSGTGVAVNATAGTGAFGALSVNGTALAGAPSGTVAAALQVTFPIGTQSLQLKSGVGTTNAGGTGTVAFGSAFPTAIISARIQPLFTGTTNDNTTAITNVFGTSASGFSVGMFNVDGNAPNTTSFFWEAWGR